MNLKDILIENLLKEFGKGDAYDYTISATGKNCEMYSIYKFVTDGKETDGTKYNFNVMIDYIDKSNYQEGSGVDIGFTTNEKEMRTLNVGLKELIKIMSTVSKIVINHIIECREEGVMTNYIQFFPVKNTKETEKYGIDSTSIREKIYKRVIRQYLPNAKFKKSGLNVIAIFDPKNLKHKI